MQGQSISDDLSQERYKISSKKGDQSARYSHKSRTATLELLFPLQRMLNSPFSPTIKAKLSLHLFEVFPFSPIGFGFFPTLIVV